ncbi:MAG: chemotaxis protein CheW [Verrucomicrobiae bacterium]
MNSTDNEMLGLFIQEASEHLLNLENDLVALETNPGDTERINRVFRAAHSIKGTAGFFGFTAIVELTHVMESVLSLVRDGKLLITPAITSLLLAATDKLTLMVANPENASSILADSEKCQLGDLLQFEPPASPEGFVLPPELAGFQIDAELVRAALRQGQNFYILTLRLKQDIEDRGQAPLHYFDEIASLGTLLDSITDIDSSSDIFDDAPPDFACSVLFATAMEEALLLGAFDLPKSQLTQIPKETFRVWIKSQPTLVPRAALPPAPAAEPPAPPLPPAQPAQPAELASLAIQPAGFQPPALSTPPAPAPVVITPQARQKTEETVRISVTLLDTLMDLAGEMVLGRNRLVRICDQFSLDNSIEGLRSVVQEINSVTSELQHSIMRARLQPVANLFSKFHRIVRDLGQGLHKEFHLELIGQDVELDRSILEGLSDPLTHLIRNSADHGIEPPDERLAAGKTAGGNIRLSAAHLAGRVQIEVRDDGRGLNPEKLKAKVVEKGLLTSEQAAHLSDQQACELIFLAGFSTVDTLSDISGRGVGMDVVKTNIERLGGRVELQSGLGEGTAVIIRLPLTLAIIPALIVSCGSKSFAIPQINLEEIVNQRSDSPLATIGDSQVLHLREELLPVIDLSRVLSQSRDGAAPDNRFVLVLKTDQTRFGIIVDEIAGTEEIVVKPLGRHLKNIPYFSGATILGQGEIALILEPSALASNIPPAASQLALGASTAVASTAEIPDQVLLFKASSPEPLALHLTNIARIECIELSDIEKIGENEYLRQKDDQTLRLLRFHEFLPLASPAADAGNLFVIVPRLIGDHAIGFLASEILDFASILESDMDRQTLNAPGILGTASILDKLTIVLNLYGVLNSAGFAAPATLTNSLPPLRILLAEDTEFFRQAVVKGIEKFVHSIDVARDGEEAWRMLQERDFDLLITDIEMPVLDGFELTRRIRATPKLQNLPIIALSARGSDTFRDKAREVGINHYETKLDSDRLRKAMESAIASSHPALAPALLAPAHKA